VFSIVPSSSPTITVTSPNGGERLIVGSIHKIAWTTSGSVGNVKITLSTNNGSSWSIITSSTSNDGKYSWRVPDLESPACLVCINEVSDGSPSDTSDAVFTIFAPTPPEIALNRTQFNFCALSSGTFTDSQVLWLNNSGGGTLNWSTDAGVPWLNCTPGSGTNAGVLTVSVNPAGLTEGSYTGTITITDPNASNSPQTVNVNLIVKSASQDQPPFGEFATPTHGSIVRSSIPVTGWVLDDVEVKSVKIYNGSGYVGDAMFVEGARPDVEQAYPDYPKNSQAGWGYMLLTNSLPNGGNGTYTLYAKGADSTGNQVTLGSKTINCDNAHAVKPFGTIDTPDQGGTASGANYVNWGWVLTPQPNHIPNDGSTINVWVDGVKLGHPTYNIYRSDIATLFPGYANSNGAVGYFYLDTTAFGNGVHTIQWTATDNAGNTDGIGSRYFMTRNSTQHNAQSAGRTAQGKEFEVNSSKPVGIIKGYKTGLEPAELEMIYPNERGMITVEAKEMERFELHFGGEGKLYGQMLVGNQFRPMPIGAYLDSNKGIFYWQIGAGFLGKYHLIFIEEDQYGNRIGSNIVVKIKPKF
ncbi:MAG: BACON domain-containing protein, partial [Candidatus Aminicenantes bacterium]